MCVCSCGVSRQAGVCVRARVYINVSFWHTLTRTLPFCTWVCVHRYERCSVLVPIMAVNLWANNGKKWSNKTPEEHLSTEACQVQTLFWRHRERKDKLPANSHRFSLVVNIGGTDAWIQKQLHHSYQMLVKSQFIQVTKTHSLFFQMKSSHAYTFSFIFPCFEIDASGISASIPTLWYSENS